MSNLLHLRRSTREIDRLLLQIRGLVLVRTLLEARGATQAEIAAHTAELERQRERLAGLVQARQVNPRRKKVEPMPGT
jgi:hypothetical protein